MNLYEITSAMNILNEMDDIDPQTLADTIEGLQMELDEKLMNIGRWVRNLEAESTGIKVEEERLSKKRKAIENKVVSLKEYVRQAMLAVDKKKSSDGVITWAIQQNPPKVEIDPDAELPLCWLREIPARHEYDRNAIGQALKGGADIPGCRLISEQGVRLK